MIQVKNLDDVFTNPSKQAGCDTKLAQSAGTVELTNCFSVEG